MALVGPPPLLDTNPLTAVLGDLREERSATVPFPPGDTHFSLARTRRFANDPLPLLLDAYERFGPVFTLRLFHGNVVFMLGPAANHYITVSHASNFTWRESHFRDLIGLMPICPIGPFQLTELRFLPRNRLLAGRFRPALRFATRGPSLQA